MWDTKDSLLEALRSADSDANNDASSPSATCRRVRLESVIFVTELHSGGIRVGLTQLRALGQKNFFTFFKNYIYLMF
ncbi:hypothetical protein N665_0613s0024 [Sinapis alba]|nr:hypothetical protein N665_0613s0024 [Sinapis alba]